MGLLRSIDLVHGFKVYTTLVVLADLLRHGSQYFALLVLLRKLVLPSRRASTYAKFAESYAGSVVGAVCCLGGVFLTVGNQVMLAWLLGTRRLSLASIMQVGLQEEPRGVYLLALAIIFGVLVGLADLLVLAASPDLVWLLHKADVADSDAHLMPAATAPGLASEFFVLVSSQAFVRACFIIVLRWVQSRRYVKVLP